MCPLNCVVFLVVLAGVGRWLDEHLPEYSKEYIQGEPAGNFLETYHQN